MKKVKIIGSLLGPILAEVLRVKKWRILRVAALSGAVLYLPRLLHGKIAHSTD